jgi:protein transport protein SEC61 subunit gamma and related proteins
MFLEKVKKFLLEMRRVLRVTKKPSKQEFFSITKVAGLGILLIGLIGFLLQMGRELLFRL